MLFHRLGCFSFCEIPEKPFPSCLGEFLRPIHCFPRVSAPLFFTEVCPSVFHRCPPVVFHRCPPHCFPQMSAPMFSTDLRSIVFHRCPPRCFYRQRTWSMDIQHVLWRQHVLCPKCRFYHHRIRKSDNEQPITCSLTQTNDQVHQFQTLGPVSFRYLEERESSAREARVQILVCIYIYIYIPSLGVLGG